VENKKEKLEDFKTAISSTVRSISNSENIEVSFGNQSPKSEKNSIKLPELSQINDKLNFDQIRAMADSKSLNFRFSDDKTYKEYEPVGNISKRLYKISEKIRCEKIGTSYFKGVKNNIEKLKTIDYNKDNSEILDNYIVDELDLTLLEDNRSFIVDKKYDEIYIYGYKVSDFHVLDKDKIFTLHHTVLKKLHEESVKLEVMNEKSLEIQEIQHMKAETTNIRKKLEDMKKMINNLMVE